MRIFVTGDRGFVGSYIVKKFISSGHEVVGLDKKPLNGEVYGYQTSEGNILSRDKLVKMMSGAECVVHLAAEHQDFGVSREEFFQVNVEGTRNLLETAAALNINRLVFYSSVAVYGDQECPTSEDTQPEPVSDYGESKLKAEDEIRAWALADPARKVAIIRPAVIFGPENYANMYNLLNSLYRRRFISVGKCDNIKSVAYVENIVDATCFLLEKIEPGVEIYNYSDYPQMTAAQITDMILKYLSYPKARFSLPLGPVLAMAGIFDLMGKITGYNFPITAYRIKKFNTPTHHRSDKIRGAGFSPSISLEDGFKRMVEWYIKRAGS